MNFNTMLNAVKANPMLGLVFGLVVLPVIAGIIFLIFAVIYVPH